MELRGESVPRLVVERSQPHFVIYLLIKQLLQIIPLNLILFYSIQIVHIVFLQVFIQFLTRVIIEYLSGSQLTGLAAGVYIQKNSTKLGYINYASPTSFASGTAVVQANAGDTLQINVDSSVTCEGNATAPWITTFSIAQIK